MRINDLRVAGKHIVINSTVMPGYIKGTATFLLRDCKGCSVSYNPAFVAQGEVMRGYRTGRLVSAEDFSRLDALLFTAAAWIFIPAYCFALP